MEQQLHAAELISLIRAEAPRKVEFLIRLSLSDRKVFTFADLERDMGFTYRSRELREVLRGLASMQIIVPHDTLFGITRYKLKASKLRDYIDELAVTKLFEDYFRAYHPLVI
jgi:hypothetical protein